MLNEDSLRHMHGVSAVSTSIDGGNGMVDAKSKLLMSCMCMTSYA